MTDPAWDRFMTTDAQISACYKAKCARAAKRLTGEVSNIPFDPAKHSAQQAENYRIAYATYNIAVAEAGDQAARQQRQAEYAYNFARRAA